MDKQTVNYYLGKPVVTLEGEILGTVSNVRFTGKMSKLKFLEAFGENEDNFFVDVKRIFTAGENAVIVKSCGCVSENAEGCSPLNLPVYTAEGEYVGICYDVVLKGFVSENLLVEGGKEVPCAQIVTVGKNAVIINPDGKKLPPVKRKTSGAAAAFSESRDEAESQPEAALSESVVQTAAAGEQTAAETGGKPAPKLPDSVIANNKLLLGRKVQKDIYNQRGEIIIRKSNIITAYTLETAKKYGKLFELTVNSLSNIIN